MHELGDDCVWIIVMRHESCPSDCGFFNWPAIRSDDEISELLTLLRVARRHPLAYLLLNGSKLGEKAPKLDQWPSLSGYYGVCGNE